MNRLSAPAKGLLLPGLLAVAFALAGCFTSSPTESDVSSGAVTDGDAQSNPEDLRSPQSTGTAVAVENQAVEKPAASSGEQTPADELSGPVTPVAYADVEKSSKKAPEEYVDRMPAPMLKGWEKPKLALVFSGDQRGSLEPCGCTARQSGGFARRGDLFKQLHEKGWPIVALDLGGTLKRSRQHDQIKFERILQGLRNMRYSVLGLGPAELRLGAERLMSWHEPEDFGETSGLAFISANVVFFDNPDQGTPLPYRIVNIDDRKVAVTSVLGNHFRDQLLPRDRDSTGQPISVVSPIPALQATFEKMQAEKPDLLVLLSYAKIEETKSFAKEVPGFDVILTSGGPDEPLERTEQLGKSLLLQVGAKGKHIAILGYYPEATPKFKFELVELDKFRFKNDPAMVQLMEDFQSDLKDADLAVNERQIPHASGAGFVGAKVCGECHKKAFAKWSTTKHSHAFESLIKGRPDYEGKWVSRVHDVECLACHVTGWEPQQVVPFETGFQSPSLTPHLMGQQCENCHGPGSEHVKFEEVFKKTKRGANDPKLLKWRQKMHLDQTMAQSATGCFKCHDGDNSPKFKFAEFFKQIQHIGRD